MSEDPTRPNAAEVLAAAMSQPHTDDDVSVTFDAEFMVGRGVIAALRDAVNAGPDDGVLLKADDSLSLVPYWCEVGGTTPDPNLTTRGYYNDGGHHHCRCGAVVEWLDGIVPPHPIPRRSSVGR